MKLSKYVALVTMLVLICSILVPNVSAGYGSFVGCDYFTPTQSDTYTTATVESILKVNYIKGDGSPYEVIHHFVIKLLDSDWNPMAESDWTFKVYLNEYDHINEDTKELYRARYAPPYGCEARWKGSQFPNNYFYFIMESKVPLTTTMQTFYHSVKVYNKDTSGTCYGEWVFRYDISADTPMPEIKLSAEELPTEIKPSTQTECILQVTNNALVETYVTFSYDLTFRDAYGTKLDSDIWSITIQDENHQELTHLAIGGKEVGNAYLTITSPAKEDAPPMSTLIIDLTAKAVNDISKRSTVTLGEDENTQTSADYEGGQSYGFFVTPIAIILYSIIIIIILSIIYFKGYKYIFRKPKR